jgi:hypothetical protein
VSVDDVGDLETGETYFADALELVVLLVAVLTQLIADVREDPVALALADVEGLAVAWVDEAVDVGLELRDDIRRKGVQFRHGRSR